jgi:hypothetical protein
MPTGPRNSIRTYDKQTCAKLSRWISGDTTLPRQTEKTQCKVSASFSRKRVIELSMERSLSELSKDKPFVFIGSRPLIRSQWNLSRKLTILDDQGDPR